MAFVFLAVGAVILLATIDVTLNSTAFAFGLAVFGIGVGGLASQLGNVIMSSVEPRQTNQAGGLQGTAQNLGASLGTALIGAILLGAMTSAFVSAIDENPAIPDDLRVRLTEQATSSGLEVLPVQQVEAYLLEAGLPADQATAISTDYANSQLQGLKVALFAVAVSAVLATWSTRRLPNESTAAAEPDGAAAEPVPVPA